jgi:sporulation protein YpjB
MSMMRTKQWAAVITVLLLFTALLSGCMENQEDGRHFGTDEKRAEQVDQETWKQLEKLDYLADQFYQQVSEGNVVDARNSLLSIEAQLLKIPFAGVTSSEGAQALLDMVSQGIRVFNAVKFSLDDGQIVAAQIRLAADALTHQEQPMWLQYHRVLQDDANRLQAAIESNASKEVIQSVEQLSRDYFVIRTSAMLQREPSLVAKLDTLLSSIRTAAAEGASFEALANAMIPLKDSINELFGKGDTTATYVPIIETKQPIYWAFGLGTTILLALGYTIARMVIYDRSIISVRKGK